LPILTDIVAANVELSSDGGIDFHRNVTADSFKSNSGNNTFFQGVVRANSLEVIDAKGIKFKESVGADIVTLTAPEVSARSIHASTSILINGAFIPDTGTPSLLRGPTLEITGGINARGADGSILPLTLAPSAGGTVLLETNSFVVDNVAGGDGINADGGNAILSSLDQGGNGGAVFLGSTERPIVGDVVVKKAISATTGASATALQHGGRGGTVSIISGGKVDVQSNIKVSGSAAGRASRAGGKIYLSSQKPDGTAISITSSSQLLSLLDAAAPGAGGSITFVSAGGDILVDSGSTVRADRGTVDVRNNGAGNISLNNATLRGDVVKVGAFGPNGELRIGGGAINANTSLKLYAGGTNGTVHFTDNVTLGGASVKTIAGRTVTIDNLKTVTIGGSAPARVFSDVPNYTGSGGNGSTTGAFGGKGATTQPFGSRPAF